VSERINGGKKKVSKDMEERERERGREANRDSLG
jgi:hypothetical protein